MKLNWAKWFYDLCDDMLRHVGTAALTWGGLTLKHWGELHSAWGDLGVSLLTGAVIPTVATFLANRGLPKDEETTH